MESVVKAMGFGHHRRGAPSRAARESVQELLDSDSDDDHDASSRGAARASSRHPLPPKVTSGMQHRQDAALAVWDSEDSDEDVDEAPQVADMRDQREAQCKVAARSLPTPEDREARPARARKADKVFPADKKGDVGKADANADTELFLWLNSLEFPSALLASGVADLRSGQTVHDCMSVFLLNVSPADLTAAPGHPGPPSKRISSSLDALASAVRDGLGMTAAERVKTLVHVPVLREALLIEPSPIVAGAEWVDDLLIWMISLFRYLAHQEGEGAHVLLPDRSRLMKAAEAAAFCLDHEHCNDADTVRSTKQQTQGKLQSRMEAPFLQLSGSERRTVFAAPQATPPLRNLPHLPQDQSTFQKDSAPKSLPACKSVTVGDPAPQTHGDTDKETCEPRARGGKEADTRRSDTAPDFPSETSATLTGGFLATHHLSSKGQTKGDAKRAPSPMHSGRPSAPPVTPATPKHRSRSAPNRHREEPRNEAAFKKTHTWTKLSVAQLRIVDWLETMGVAFMRASAPAGNQSPSLRRPKGVVGQDVITSLCDGFQLSIMVSRLERVELKGIVPSHCCAPRAARVQNLERMLSLLRDKRRSMSSKWLWSAQQIADGDAAALWGLCADLHSEYAPKRIEAPLDWPALISSEGPDSCRGNDDQAQRAFDSAVSASSLTAHGALALCSGWAGSCSGPSSLRASPRSGMPPSQQVSRQGAGADVDDSSWFDRLPPPADLHGVDTEGGDVGDATSSSVRKSQLRAVACDGPDVNTRLWLQQLGVTIGAPDGSGGGGKDDGGAQPLSTKDFPSLDRGLSLLDDPQRNGRLLWDVAVAVTARQVEQQEHLTALREDRKPRKRPKDVAMFRIPYRQPKSVPEARENMSVALGLVRGCGIVVSPTLAHIGVLESILQGDNNALWSLVGAIRSASSGLVTPWPRSTHGSGMGVGAADEVRPRSTPGCMTSKTKRQGGSSGQGEVQGLLYSRRHTALLEVAVMQWMLTLPLLPDSLEALTSVVCMVNAPGVEAQVEGQVGWGKGMLAALLPELAKGPLLADVASAATGAHLQPVTRCVKTHKVAQNNQERLCEQLLLVNHLSHERLLPVLHVAQALAAGEHSATLGLLEDLMRCWFRLDARKRFFDGKGRQIPFLGPYAPAPATTSSDVVAPFCLSSTPACAAWGNSAPYVVRVDGDGKSHAPTSGEQGPAMREALGSCLSSAMTEKENEDWNGEVGIECRDTEAKSRTAATSIPRGIGEMGSASRLGPPLVARPGFAREHRRQGVEDATQGAEVDVFRQLRLARNVGRDTAKPTREAEKSRARTQSQKESHAASDHRVPRSHSHGSRRKGGDALATAREGAGAVQNAPDAQRGSPDPGAIDGSSEMEGNAAGVDSDVVVSPPERTHARALPCVLPALPCNRWVCNLLEMAGLTWGGVGTWQERITAVRRWLVRLPGGLQTPTWSRGILSGSPLEFAHAWSDGVAFCDLVAALEGLGSGVAGRGSGNALPGINRAPKSAASCRFNLNKALQVLRDKRGMRRARLFSEEAILAAEQHVALALLEDVGHAYKLNRTG